MAGAYLRLQVSDPADIPPPPSGRISLFADSTNSNIPSYKDSSGTVNTLQGATGATGDTGAAGADGNNLLVDSGAPSDANGNDGDVYIDLDTGDVYLKASGTWGTAVGTLPGGGGGASGYTMLEEQVASASASLDCTAWPNAAYETIVVELIDIITSANTELGFRVSTDGGSTWMTTNYEIFGYYAFGGGAGLLANTGVSTISLRAGNNSTLLADCGYQATLKFPNVVSAGHKFFTMDHLVPDASAGVISLRSGGRVKTTSAINGIQVVPLSGTLTSGRVRVYGVRKAA